MRQQNERLFGVTFARGDVRRIVIIRLRARRCTPITQYFAHKSRENDCNWRGVQRSSIGGAPRERMQQAQWIDGGKTVAPRKAQDSGGDFG